jgi:hypothetical protein
VNYIERSKEIIGIILKLKEAIISMKRMVLNIQYHGAKEIGTGLLKKIIKEMSLKL